MSLAHHCKGGNQLFAGHPILSQFSRKDGALVLQPPAEGSWPTAGGRCLLRQQQLAFYLEALRKHLSARVGLAAADRHNVQALGHNRLSGFGAHA